MSKSIYTLFIFFITSSTPDIQTYPEPYTKRSLHSFTWMPMTHSINIYITDETEKWGDHRTHNCTHDCPFYVS